MLIGLYGPSRAGKDTVAGVLVRHHGFEQRNMANPIREVLLKMDPMVYNEEEKTWFTLSSQVEEFGWDTVKKWYPESVDWMIALGQGMRDIDPNIWLGACTNPEYTDLVIADVRQPNEYLYINEHGGEVWRIERPGTEMRGMDGLLDDYEFDVEIVNNSDIETLEEFVNLIMEDRNGS